MVYVLYVTPADGYELDRIYINGQPVTLKKIGDEYVIRNLTDDMNITANFKLINDGSGDNGNNDNNSTPSRY